MHCQTAIGLGLCLAFGTLLPAAAQPVGNGDRLHRKLKHIRHRKPAIPQTVPRLRRRCNDRLTTRLRPN